MRARAAAGVPIHTPTCILPACRPTHPYLHKDAACRHLKLRGIPGVWQAASVTQLPAIAEQAKQLVPRHPALPAVAADTAGVGTAAAAGGCTTAVGGAGRCCEGIAVQQGLQLPHALPHLGPVGGIVDVAVADGMQPGGDLLQANALAPTATAAAAAAGTAPIAEVRHTLGENVGSKHVETRIGRCVQAGQVGGRRRELLLLLVPAPPDKVNGQGAAGGGPLDSIAQLQAMAVTQMR